jgi:hypothetical protein
MTEKPLPVPGYTAQSGRNVALVTMHKENEERLLRHFDKMALSPDIDKRWLAIGRTHIEQGFMAVNRAVFKPQRIVLPEDEKPAEQSSLPL